VLFIISVFSKISGLKAGKVKHNIINAHIYDSHINAIKEQLSRKPSKLEVKFNINEWVKSFDDLVGSDTHAREYFTLKGYNPQGKIEMDLVA
jgi:thymidylate synthase